MLTKDNGCEMVLYVQKGWRDVDHLLLHCDYARDLWSLVLCLFGVQWVMPNSVVYLLACWKGRFAKHCNGDIWSAIPLCIMWTVRRECNNKVFEFLNKLQQIFR